MLIKSKLIVTLNEENGNKLEIEFKIFKVEKNGMPKTFGLPGNALQYLPVAR